MVTTPVSGPSPPPPPDDGVAVVTAATLLLAVVRRDAMYLEALTELRTMQQTAEEE